MSGEMEHVGLFETVDQSRFAHPARKKDGTDILSVLEEHAASPSSLCGRSREISLGIGYDQVPGRKPKGSLLHNASRRPNADDPAHIEKPAEEIIAVVKQLPGNPGEAAVDGQQQVFAGVFRQLDAQGGRNQLLVEILSHLADAVQAVVSRQRRRRPWLSRGRFRNRLSETPHDFIGL